MSSKAVANICYWLAIQYSEFVARHPVPSTLHSSLFTHHCSSSLLLDNPFVNAIQVLRGKIADFDFPALLIPLHFDARAEGAFHFQHRRAHVGVELGCLLGILLRRL